MMKSRPARYRRKSSPSRAYPRARASKTTTLQYVTGGFVLLLVIFFLLSRRSAAVQDLRLFHHTPTHKPPSQKNSTSGQVHWHSDWKWLKPFSASITLDEDRSVLPPLSTRPPIYTYYDNNEKKDPNVKAAEHQLLLLWRRAWWAQGFRPVVLGSAEAKQNEHYHAVQKGDLQTQMRTEMMKWLAWGSMGTGVLANWLVYPMVNTDDELLSRLRKGDYPALSRYEGLGVGFFAGEQTSINSAIKNAMASPELKEAKSFPELLSKDQLSVSPKPAEIAFYDSSTNSDHYKAVTVALAEDKAEGLKSLAKLINSHLHLTFLNKYAGGLTVLKPFRQSAGVLARKARSLAEAVRACPESPIPTSCPPNHLECTPCSSTSPLPIRPSATYTNTSDTFTIGSVPHPLTLASLNRKSKEISARYIRRETSRDPWLASITEKILGTGRGGLGRIVTFKEMVASEWGSERNLWLADGQVMHHKSLEYHFGFTINSLDDNSKEQNPLDEDEDTTLSPKQTNDLLRSIKLQTDLITHSQRVLARKEERSKDAAAGGSLGKASTTGVAEMVEAWNLADTEAWRFVRAFTARATVERMHWEEEERKFAGGDVD